MDRRGRGAAAGGAQVAVNRSIWSHNYNPAGLAHNKNIGAGFAFTDPGTYGFASLSMFSAALPLSEKWGTLSLHGDMLSVKNGDAVLSSENALGVSHGVHLLKDLRSSLSLGYSLNFLFVNYGQSAGLSGDGSDGIDLGSVSGLGMDVGLQASLRDRAWMGIAVKNINAPKFGGSESEAEALRKFVVGLGYSPYYGLTSSFEIEKVFGQDAQYRAGLEYAIMEWFSLRTGFSTYPSQLTFGFGVEKSFISVDYAFVSHPVLNGTHVFTLEIYKP
ncbi:MAG: conjugal transfer protein TraF [Candidatus Marinimicrobia bacterium]|nr:conjugal transfer protein TraF [Candidatus Neomarinimicrobiota bacterium]